MCIGLSVIFLIYQGLVVFFYTTVSNLLTISEGKIRAWIVMTMICCGLVYPGFFSLIISHYVRDRVQQLRCTLRAQLPQVYFYDRVSTGSSAGAAYHVHAVNHSTSTNISLQASELSTHLTKSPSVAAVLHGDRRRTTIVPPVPLTERSIKTSVSSTTPLNDVASGLTRSGTRKDVANIPPAIAKTGELTELRGEKLHEAAERLRKLSKFDKEYCSLLYFLVTAVPVFCFVTWLLSSKLGKPDFEGFMVYYYFICALIADVLVLLSQPWNQLSDNFGVKYQISTAAVLVTAYQSGTVYSWARAVSHEEERDKIGLIMSWFLVFFPIVYQLLLIVIPTVIAIIPSNQDTVHRSGVGLWFLRSQTTAGSEQSLAAPSWDDSSSQTSTYPRMDSISGGGLTDATKKSSGGDSTPPVSENRTVIIAEPREADRLERPRTTSGGGLKATAPTTKQKSRPRSAAYPPTRELDAILFNAQALQALTQFSAHEYCTENLLFLGAAFEYRVQYNRKTSEARMAYAETIYNDYVRAGSFNEVNLPGTLRRELDHALHKDAVAQKEQWQGQLIFEDAVDHIK
ncbi:hypothetical protein DFS34DRAFT_354497 [Phlyctochytrium arcticum]|nr:hypothetical protein DFS34DRAFT_354497 [Phlyctochytrium arcticum]